MNSFFKNLNNFESPTILGPMIILSAMKYPNMKKKTNLKEFRFVPQAKKNDYISSKMVLYYLLVFSFSFAPSRFFPFIFYEQVRKAFFPSTQLRFLLFVQFFPCIPTENLRKVSSPE